MLHRCRGCKSERPESEFYTHSTSGKRRTYCTTCEKGSSKDRYYANKAARKGAPDPRYGQIETKGRVVKVARYAREAELVAWLVANPTQTPAQALETLGFRPTVWDAVRKQFAITYQRTIVRVQIKEVKNKV